MTEEMTEENTKADILAYITDVLDRRKKEMQDLVVQIKAKKEEE